LSGFHRPGVPTAVVVARLWREPYTLEKARAACVRDWEDHLIVGPPNAPWIFYVEVCRFTFAFFSLDMIRRYRDFYAAEVLPSSRLSGPLWSPAGCNQRWFERLPLRLRKEPRRRRVVRALDRALAEFAAEE
jgi:hypothetical protein